MDLQSITFNFSRDVCTIDLQSDTASYEISFGAGTWQTGVTNMAGPSLTTTAIENTEMLYPTKIAGSYTWSDANTLELVLRYIESPHAETFTCHFTGDRLTMEIAKSLDFGKKKTVLEAVLK